MRSAHRSESAEYVLAVHSGQSGHHGRVVQAVFAAVLRQVRALLAASGIVGHGHARVASALVHMSQACQGSRQAALGRRRLHLDRAAFKAHQGQAHRAEGCRRRSSPAVHRHRVSSRQSDLRRLSACRGQRYTYTYDTQTFTFHFFD